MNKTQKYLTAFCPCSYRLSDIRVFFDCVANKNQICDERGHVRCVPGYYGNECRRYCNATMFETCNCTTVGELQCNEKPVGAFFEVRLVSVHIPPRMRNVSYALNFRQK